MSDERRDHWEKVFTTKPDDTVSWFEATPETSLRLIRACGLPPDAHILDVGAGASRLPDALLTEGFTNITLLDISPAALAQTRQRLGHRADHLRFIVADVTEWRPDVAVDLWHDRAVLHFLTNEADRTAYVDALYRAVKPGGFAVIAGFSPTGPERCSGLPVRRASVDAIAALLGPQFNLLETFEEDHRTPAGGRQRFLFTRFLRARAE